MTLKFWYRPLPGVGVGKYYKLSDLYFSFLSISVSGVKWSHTDGQTVLPDCLTLKTVNIWSASSLRDIQSVKKCSRLCLDLVGPVNIVKKYNSGSGYEIKRLC